MKRMTLGIAAALGLLGTVLLGWGFALDVQQAAYAYLVAFVYVLTIAVGALFILMIGNASNAKWFVPLRRQCEVVVGALPIIAAMLIPVLALVPTLYPWVHPHELPRLVQHHVEKKSAWLNEPFFISRSIGYVLLFVVFGELLRRWSIQQDAGDGAKAIRLHRRMTRFSVGGIVLLSLVLTFASWDWIMSLEPAWFSNMYGLYVFSGGFLAALGLLGVMSVIAHKRQALPKEVAEQHWHAIGRLQLAMVIFWTYIGWAHVLQHWIANVPVEQLWYIRRWNGGWQWVGLALVIAHWAIPFFLLLSKSIKKNAVTFIGVSAYLVLVHALDVFYLVAPVLHERAFHLSWMNFAALGALVGWTLCFAALRARRIQPVPSGDPLFEEGVAYESQS